MEIKKKYSRQIKVIMYVVETVRYDLIYFLKNTKKKYMPLCRHMYVKISFKC